MREFCASIMAIRLRWQGREKPPSHGGRYWTAQRYLQLAVNAKPQDPTLRYLLSSANLILETDPFVRRISDAERNRRIAAAFAKAGERLSACAQQRGVNLAGAGNPSVTSSLSSSLAPPALAALESRWMATRRDLPHLRSAAEADLPDAIMDLVFQIEQQTAEDCGEPQGVDQALLLISRDRETADR